METLRNKLGSVPTTGPLSFRAVGFWRGVGFTLVELLVVIAIITVLVGILMPALGRARTSAQRTVCRANLHSAGMSMQSYLDTEAHDIYPDACMMPSVDSSKPGIAVVLKVYLGDPKVLKCPNDKPNDIATNGQKDLYYNVEGTSYEYPPFLHGKKVSAVLEEQSPILFDFEAFHGTRGENSYLNFLDVASWKIFHSSEMEKGSINFLNADGSVDS